MASRRFDVGQGALASFVVGSLLMASACSSDSSVDFDPTPSGGGDTSSGGTKPSGSGSGSGAAQSGGSSNATAGESAGGTESGAGTSANAGTNSGGSVGTSGTDGGGKAGSGRGGSDSGGTAGSSSTAGTSANAGNGGTTAGAGGTTAGAGGSGGGNGDCVAATYGGHAYYFCGVVESAVAAYAKCQSLGMKMVEIESMAEHTFVTGKQKGQSWLGGADELKESEWRWASSGQVFWDGGPRVMAGGPGMQGNDGRVEGVYSNFIVGQPNNSNDDGFPENCLAINANGWNDLYCNLPDVRAACEAAGPVILPKP